MSAAADKLSTQTTASTGDSKQLVGVALIHFSNEFTMGSVAIADALFRECLDQAGVQTYQWEGLVLPTLYVATIEVSDRKRAIRELELLCRRRLAFFHVEIAYFDCAEGYWRTVTPPGAAPFDRLLSQENVRAARNALALWSLNAHSSAARLAAGKQHDAPNSPG